ncbi:Kynurenine 3-monooxygenase [Diplonema papillatum]|nr:Kynurenine 3-monooxygenase [Diplonema papillatum]
MSDSVIIVGAGLCGSLLAVNLMRRGFNVQIFESRPDLRLESLNVHRSINLVLTSRGRFALRGLGLEDEIMKLVVPAVGRAIHNIDGSVIIQPYGKDNNEANYSISRSRLNMSLLDFAEKAGAKIHFDMRLVSADINKMQYTFAKPDGKQATVFAPVCFGADGAGSVVRRQLIKHLIDVPVPELDLGMKQHPIWGGNTSIKTEVQRLGVSYKELTFPLKADGSKPLETQYLHIWPRGSHFLMGLANMDGSMTGTLYLPDNSTKLQTDLLFENLQGKELGKKYLREYYPDAEPILPNFEREWEENPHAFLATCRVSHWAWKGSICLLGDAAHALVPFFGQGMNASFEDVTYISYLLDKHQVAPATGHWQRVFDDYQLLRIPAGHAISDLAIENCDEMCSKVGQAEFLALKQIENAVEKEVPTLFRSRYWMVTNSLIPYHWVQELGTHINAVVTELAKTATFKDGIPIPDMSHARSLIAVHVTPYLRSHGIDLTDPWRFYGPRELQYNVASKL